MTDRNREAVVASIEINVDMMLHSDTPDECSSAYVRAIDGLTKLHLGIMKDKIRKTERRN